MPLGAYESRFHDDVCLQGTEELVASQWFGFEACRNEMCTYVQVHDMWMCSMFQVFVLLVFHSKISKARRGWLGSSVFRF